MWVLVQFLMPKTKVWSWISACLLLLLITGSRIVELNDISISLTIPLIIMGSILILSLHAKQIRMSLLALTVCVGYVGALCWEMVSPVWIFAPRILIFSVMAYALLLFMSGSMWVRIAIWGLGSSVGEVVYALLLSNYGYNELAGDKSYLDIFSVVIILVVVTSMMSKLSSWMEQTITEFVKRKTGMKT